MNVRTDPVIFGSRAKGNYRTGSDIDLTIKDGEISFAELMQIENQIDDLMLPYTVDLFQYNQINNKDLIEHIDHIWVVIYAYDMKNKPVIDAKLAQVKA